jgi:hypothetical protein
MSATQVSKLVQEESGQVSVGKACRQPNSADPARSVTSVHERTLPEVSWILPSKGDDFTAVHGKGGPGQIRKLARDKPSDALEERLEAPIGEAMKEG